MNTFKIGIMVDSFKAGFDRGIEKAGQLGAEGVQINAASGEMAPENVTKAVLREKRAMIRANGLETAAVCGDLGGYGFTKADENGMKIQKTKRIIDLALELDCRIVTTHIGVVPQDKSTERYDVLQKACYELGSYAQASGAVLAVETGPEKAQTLADFIVETGTEGIGVNLDPANFVMVTNDDPVRAVYTLRGHIVHTHAKDGVMLRATDPQIIYDCFAQGGISDLRLEEYFKEVPLGSGRVDFDGYLKALRETGYDGYLTIEREVGDNPEADIALAVSFLRSRI
jgi:L-ribulose-5-phosphate 3-epimerase